MFHMTMLPSWMGLNVVLGGIIVFMLGVTVAIVYDRLGGPSLAVGVGGGLSIAGVLTGIWSLDVVGFVYPFIEAIIRTLQAVTVIYMPEIFPLEIFGGFAGLFLVSYVVFRMFQATDAAAEAADEIDE